MKKIFILLVIVTFITCKKQDSPENNTPPQEIKMRIKTANWGEQKDIYEYNNEDQIVKYNYLLNDTVNYFLVFEYEDGIINRSFHDSNRITYYYQDSVVTIADSTHEIRYISNGKVVKYIASNTNMGRHYYYEASYLWDGELFMIKNLKMFGFRHYGIVYIVKFHYIQVFINTVFTILSYIKFCTISKYFLIL